jgi:hypothetical protein
MTLIAELDATQDPAVVVTMYDYGSDTIPPHMVAPAFVNATDADPRPEPGYTYDGETFSPGAPQALEQVRQAGRDQLHDCLRPNQMFLRARDASTATINQQVRALTEQVNLLIRGALQVFPPTMAPGVPPASSVAPPEEPPPDEPPVEPPPPDVEPSPPVAAFTFTPTEPQKGDQVQFDASSSTPGATPIARYDWSFGADELLDAGPTPMYTFTKFGSYDVTLAVTDDDGVAAETVQTIQI